MISLFQTRPEEKSRIPRILGYGLAIICLVWVLRDFHIVKAMRQFAAADWRWVLLGMGFDVLSYVVQAIRWKFLLTPFGKVKLTTAIRAVYAGIFANLVLPLRPGEVLRSYLIANSEEMSIGRVLGSVGVERLIDLVIATASLGVVSLFLTGESGSMELPRNLKRAADILGVVSLLLVSILVFLILYLEFKLGKNPELSSKKGRHLPSRFMGALTGLHAMGTAPSFYLAVVTSIGLPACQVLGLWCMMKSYGLHLSFMAAVVVLLVINLGVSLPNAPANVGAYQFFCVVGVSIFNIEKDTATGFSIFAFLALTIPFVFLGFAALLRSGMSLRSMREKVSALPRQVSSSSAVS
ncbi:MAG TPA: lysylphosphatidylglycerol synthase transmembrane domain-containing protein [Candidatus Acidoferrum sp.]|nr:lysylphosphatidylglycerol synthase transmembrane domain-containing protein [Candidatus Acidoferrum sp.]